MIKPKLGGSISFQKESVWDIFKFMWFHVSLVMIAFAALFVWEENLIPSNIVSYFILTAFWLALLGSFIGYILQDGDDNMRKPNPKGKDFQNENIEETKFQNWWWFHIRHRCPICHAKLWEKGYPQDFMQAYKCSDRKCGWSWSRSIKCPFCNSKAIEKFDKKYNSEFHCVKCNAISTN